MERNRLLANWGKKRAVNTHIIMAYISLEVTRY